LHKYAAHWKFTDSLAMQISVSRMTDGGSPKCQ